MATALALASVMSGSSLLFDGRIIGAGDLWVTEFILTYDGQPSYSVSVMEFLDGKVIA